MTETRDGAVRDLVGRILDLEKDDAFSEESVTSQEQFVFARDKVFALTRALQSLLDSTPPILVSTTALKALATNLTPTVAELTVFVADKNPAHLVSAESHYEQFVLPHMWGFAPHAVNSNLYPELLTQLQSLASQAIQRLSKARDDLQGKVIAAEGRLSDLQSKVEELLQTIAKDRAEAAATVALLNQKFNENEIDRDSAFASVIKQIRVEFDDVLKNANESTLAVLEDLEQKQQQAARIVQVVGNIGVTGNYQNISASEYAQADFWRWITILFFAVGVGVAISTFVKYWGESFSPEHGWSILIRLIYALAITAPAWYTAKESARHRTNADRAKQTELELASLGPFIELMDDKKKEEIRESLVKIYFGKPVEAHEAQPPVDMAKLAVDLAKALKG